MAAPRRRWRRVDVERLPGDSASGHTRGCPFLSADQQSDAPPKRPFFKSRANTPKLSQDRAMRQGQVTHLAFSLLGGRDPAMAFLNTFSPSLGGRPLDVAMADDTGLTSVMSAIRLLAMPPHGAKQ